MLLVPAPFVTVLLMLILLGFAMNQGETVRRSVVVFLCASIVLLGLVGLRWSSDLAVFRLLQPIVAAFLPPAAWLCFADLQAPRRAPAWLHFAPTGLVAALSLLWPILHSPIDVILALLFLGYGCELLRQGLRGPDRLARARLGSAVQADRAAMGAGGLLIASGATDLAIAADFGMGSGSHAAAIVSAANLLTIPLIAWAIIVMGRSVPGTEAASGAARTPEEPFPAPSLPDPGDDEVLTRLRQAMEERRFYRDPDLTLDKLSRRLGLPAKQVSGAINRCLGRNVSQEINGWRVRDAMTLLRETDRPITAIMFDCGFQTKSTFNREFLRIGGTSPSRWRAAARHDDASFNAPEAPSPGSPGSARQPPDG